MSYKHDFISDNPYLTYADASDASISDALGAASDAMDAATAASTAAAAAAPLILTVGDGSKLSMKANKLIAAMDGTRSIFLRIQETNVIYMAPLVAYMLVGTAHTFYFSAVDDGNAALLIASTTSAAGYPVLS